MKKPGLIVAVTGAVACASVGVIASDWPTNLSPDVIPVLFFEAGVAGSSDQSIPPVSGSYFSMQVSSAISVYTTLSPGPSAGVVIGHNQPATGSHTGAASGNEQTGIDAPWLFFSNTGFDLTQNGGIIGNPDGTLEFKTRWYVTWNGVPAINLGGSSQFPEDLGYASITCTPAPCADQSTFYFDPPFAAHVEDLPGQPPSGFNGVPYTLGMEGVVRFLDATLKASDGTLTTAERLSVEQLADENIPLDSEVDQQCVGDCFDYTLSTVTIPSVSIVMPLAGGVPNKPVWRIFSNNNWVNFDTTQGDTIESAPFPAAGQTQCPDPGSPDYGPLTTGHYCVQLTIMDNGPNDTDPVIGTVSDPGGMGGGGTGGGGEVFVDKRTTNSSGCTLSSNTAPNLGQWGLPAGFIAWLGWRRRKRTCR
ncbi:MAG: hypothetical protein WCH04_16880 [Gammaproteobacteria bacterium]